MFLLKCCVAGNAFPMKSTKLVSLMAAAVGASIVLSPSDAKETLENPAHLRDNRTVIAGMDWVDGRQAAWLW